MLTVPIAGVEVLHSVGLEQDGAVGEPRLFGAGVVPERVGVAERDVGGGLGTHFGRRCWG